MDTNTARPELDYLRRPVIFPSVTRFDEIFSQHERFYLGTDTSKYTDLFDTECWPKISDFCPVDLRVPKLGGGTQRYLTRYLRVTPCGGVLDELRKLLYDDDSVYNFKVVDHGNGYSLVVIDRHYVAYVLTESVPEGGSWSPDKEEI